MIYLSAQYIAIKKDQDRTAFRSNKMIICDGIGEFADSAKAAEITIDNLLIAEKKNEISALIEKSASDIKVESITGGTTLIAAFIDIAEGIPPLVQLAYIGNGSIFHLHGNFNELPSSYNSSNIPYRFSNIMIPHIDKDGILVRHISHHSTPQELIPSFVELSLSGINGDILLIFSDGISSLEDDIIVVDDHQRVWRNESEIVSIILKNLHEWLATNCKEITQIKIDNFLVSELEKLKDLDKLEDDASIGLIFTDSVLEYYKALTNVV